MTDSREGCSALCNGLAPRALSLPMRRQFGGFASMFDIVFIAATALFFALGILYVRGCERLK
ncbi:MAG: hypothetical protein ACRD3D_07940 [Terriglobia bacterium]